MRHNVPPVREEGGVMTPIQLMVLAGVLLLIAALNLKLAIWYIEKKQAKLALENYNRSHLGEEAAQTPIAFSVSEIKCAGSIKKNIDSYLDALKSNEFEKIGIMKEDELIAVMLPLERYEKLLESIIEDKVKNEH